MARRFISLWFRQLKANWAVRCRPALGSVPFALAMASSGKMILTAVNSLAQTKGVQVGMAVADARVLIPTIEVLDDLPGVNEKLLYNMACWCIRYTPVAAVDLDADGLLLDVTGCPHLWGGERAYLKEIVTRLRAMGYDVRGAIADTVGAAWAVARYGTITPIIEVGRHAEALLSLPPAALRIDTQTRARLQKLGIFEIAAIASMQRSALRRRFGSEILLRLDQAIGLQEELITGVLPGEIYLERLPCLEPIRTAPGIEIALTKLLDMLCIRLQTDGKGLRKAVFKGYRIDGRIVQVEIGTNRATHNVKHIFKLFELKIPDIEPDLGIELFTLEASSTEEVVTKQRILWSAACGLEDVRLSELLDKVANKVGTGVIHRYVPEEHYWPERSLKPTASLDDKGETQWPEDTPRPIYLLPYPELIVVTAPVPDYPPMNFRHRGKFYKVAKAEGPERIEEEWWIDHAQHRDYFRVEDEDGGRYWIFRAGHYQPGPTSQWYLHGFFA